MEYISTAEDLVWLLSAGAMGGLAGAGPLGDSAPQGEPGSPALEHPLGRHRWQLRVPGSHPCSGSSRAFHVPGRPRPRTAQPDPSRLWCEKCRWEQEHHVPLVLGQTSKRRNRLGGGHGGNSVPRGGKPTAVSQRSKPGAGPCPLWLRQGPGRTRAGWALGSLDQQSGQ